MIVEAIILCTYSAAALGLDTLDMLEQVPGFTFSNDGQGRGLGQASTNVLINGQRLSSKSQDIFDQLGQVEGVDRQPAVQQPGGGVDAR